MRLKPLESVDYTYVCADTRHPDEMRTGEDLAKRHRAQGYAGIAVHYVIEQTGQIYKGRDLTEPGALAKCLNKCAWQVCVLGNPVLPGQPPFYRKQIDALRELLRSLGKPVVYADDYPGARYEHNSLPKGDADCL